MMKETTDVENVVYRKDYRPPVYLIPHIDLVIDLDETKTLVTATSQVKLNGDPGQALKLDGDDQKLLSVAINGETLPTSDYYVDQNTQQLVIPKVPKEFELTIVCEINPTKNREKAQGLYFSGGQFVTHNEAEGFRGITYFVDRPDNLATYNTEVRAAKKEYPVLLANGNPAGHTSLADGRHAVRWSDPIPKPSYLFAMVGGNLMAVEDHLITKSGKDVTLKIFVPEEDIDKTLTAMESLKYTLRWKEEVYDIEYDLDTYMIAQAKDFNAGAMENKGLNIFNRSGLLAHKETSLDKDVFYVRTAVPHECAHNEFGNRASPRSWFELFVKEGWATYLEQKCHARELGELAARQRVKVVDVIRTRQFAEELSAMGHPVQLDAYTEIDNFYTLTTYYKGAELLHVLERLIGPEAMIKGVQQFLNTYDGKSVNLDNVLSSMSIASGKDLSQFRLWYTQAGTPEVKVKEHFDAEKETYTLTFQQHLASKDPSKINLPLVIPLSMALFSAKGEMLDCTLQGKKNPSKEKMLILDQATQSFTFTGIKEKPVPSVLRNFSSPVKITESPNTRENWELLMQSETCHVQRWNVAQSLFKNCIVDLMAMGQGKSKFFHFPEEAIRNVLLDTSLPAGIRADILSTPSLSALMNAYPGHDPADLNNARKLWKQFVAGKLSKELIEIYNALSLEGSEGISSNDASLRALKNTCLEFLCAEGETESLSLLKKQYLTSRNFTDRCAVISLLCDSDNASWQKLGDELLEDMYRHWKHEPLVMENWLNIQASIENPNVVQRVQKLLSHPAFDITNPNCVRELLRTFIRNPIGFHQEDGWGYRLIADAVIKLDPINFSMAADLCRYLLEWDAIDPARQHLMVQEIVRINQQPVLTKGVREIVTKGMDAAIQQGLLPKPAKEEKEHCPLLKKAAENCVLMREGEKGDSLDDVGIDKLKFNTKLNQ